MLKPRKANSTKPLSKDRGGQDRTWVWWKSIGWYLFTDRNWKSAAKFLVIDKVRWQECSSTTRRRWSRESL